MEPICCVAKWIDRYAAELARNDNSIHTAFLKKLNMWLAMLYGFTDFTLLTTYNVASLL